MASGVGTDVPQVVHDMHRDKWMRNSDGLGVPQASADTEQARGYRIQIHRVNSHSRELITRAPVVTMNSLVCRREKERYRFYMLLSKYSIQFMI